MWDLHLMNIFFKKKLIFTDKKIGSFMITRLFLSCVVFYIY
jgi:hypothetical protein